MKLVRDYIPDIIKEDGKTCVSRVCKNPEEFRERLKDKMVEETDEFLENPSYEEAADMYEVLRALANLYGLSMKTIYETADEKRLDRGGFDDGIILERVDTGRRRYKV